LVITAQRSERVKERRRALVTGGAVRVGRAIALALAAAGMDVAIGYHRSAGEARRTRAAIAATGARAVALRANLADPRAAQRLVRQAAAALGGLDILVNNAALFVRTPFATTTPAQYDLMLDVNLRAPFFCAQAAAAVMARGSRIVNIADVGAVKTWSGYIPYTLSKAGILALTRTLAVVLRARGIAVNCVAPGPVLRPSGFPLARWEAATRGRVASLDDVVAAVAFFATCGPSISGQVLYVDGGETA
jgi:pteridine reductase